MVHTPIPYASFQDASNFTVSEGGLWDVYSSGDPPGFVYPPRAIALGSSLIYIPFSGTIYSDIGVGSIGGPNSTLNYCWSFDACASLTNALNITTTVGDDSYQFAVYGCPAVFGSWTGTGSDPQPCGTLVVNSESSVRLTISTLYTGQGLENASAYFGDFTFYLSLNSSAPLQPDPPTPSAVTSSNQSLVIPLICGIIPGLFVVGVVVLLWWRGWFKRNTWRRALMPENKTGETIEGRLNPLFVNGGHRRSRDAMEERLPERMIMDGHGLDVVEKIRRGIPVAYPLPESLAIERGEKQNHLARSNPITAAPIIPDTTLEVSTLNIPILGTDTQSFSLLNPFESESVLASRDRERQDALLQSSALSSDQQAMLDLAILEEQVSRFYISDPGPDILSLPIPTAPSELAQRVNFVSHLLQQILASSMPPEGSEVSETHLPAYDQGAWSDNSQHNHIDS